MFGSFGKSLLKEIYPENIKERDLEGDEDLIQLIDNNHIYEIEIDVLDIKPRKKRELDDILTQFVGRERERFGGRRRPPPFGAPARNKK